MCPECEQSLYRLHTPLCHICSHPTQSPQEIHCSACQQTKPSFEKATSLFVYAGVVRHMLHRYKYRSDALAGKTIEHLMAESTASMNLEWWRFGIVTTVPLHPKRLRQRGFNQGVRLALSIPALTKGEMHWDILQRDKATLPQYDLTHQERQDNLKKAFSINKKKKILLQGQRILLVDDILTTGATAEACTYHLLHAGARSVEILTLCRAVL